MSYDIMVFEASAAPRDSAAFQAWYRQQTRWLEDHSYENPAVASPALQRWFTEIIERFPPMNGPLAPRPLPDDSAVTDHCIGKNVICSGFASSQGMSGYAAAKALARKHGLGFYACSEPDGELLFPESAGW